jgi:hypothetical protein
MRTVALAEVRLTPMPTEVPLPQNALEKGIQVHWFAGAVMG